MENTLSLIQSYDEAQVQQALSQLGPYMTLVQNNNRMFQSGIGLNISGIFDDASLKRTSLFNSTITASSFINTALTGSYFSETELQDSVFDESNLQYCHFIHASFSRVKICNTNLSYSNFFHTDFKNTLFKGSTVSELLFDECSFEDCTFTASMLENAVFSRCTLKNVHFINTNIEFMELKQCVIKEVVMPFAQVSYVYGAYAHLANGDIHVKADEHCCLTGDKYLALQDPLIVYYTSIAEYFPLTNLYLVRKEMASAYQCIVLGLQSSIISKNFRMLKFYCKLAVQGEFFEYQKLRELYTLIDACVKKQDLNVYEQRDFIRNSAEIRTLLLDNIYDYPSVQIILQTNIDSNESGKVIQFIEYIDHAVRLLCSKQISHIEYRHNSDSNFIVFLSANYQEILLVLTTLLTFATNITQNILNQQQIKLNELKIKREAAELEKIEKVKKEGEQLKANGIQYEVKYYIDNVSIVETQSINLYL